MPSPADTAEISTRPQAMTDTAEAGVEAGNESAGGNEMGLGVEDRGEAVAGAPWAVEPKEDPNGDEMEDDPEEAEEGVEGREGSADEGAAVPLGGDAAAAAESEVATKVAGDEETAGVIAIAEGGDEDTGVEPVEEDPEEVMEADEELEEEAAEEPEEGEDGAEEDEGEAGSEEGAQEGEEMEEAAAEVSQEGATVNDGNDKHLEIFVGGLLKDCVEQDIAMVFSKYGEIESITIARNPATNKSKRRAFVRYADNDAAKKALAEFKDGTEVKGKKVRVSVARHMQVKTVHLKHVPRTWDEKNIEECCQGYGKIQNIRLLRGKKKCYSFVEFSSSKSALACVEGISNAEISDGDVKLIACLARPPHKVQLANKSFEGGFEVNSGGTPKGADKSKMKKGQEQGIYMKNKSQHKFLKVDQSKLPSQGEVEVPQTSIRSKGKAKAGKRQNTCVDGRQLKKARNSCDESKPPSQGDANVLQTSTHSEGKGKAGMSKSKSVIERPLKKARKNRDKNKPFTQDDLVAQKSDSFKGKKKVQKRNMKHHAGPRYATNNQANSIVGATFRSKPHAHDLEPHAGFIPPVNHVQRIHAHNHQRAAPCNIHQIRGFPYARERPAPQPAYPVHTNNAAGYEAGYAYTYLHPPPPSSMSYHPGSGPYIRRRYF